MIDKQSGHVAYAILSYGGLFGLGARLFPLPWSVLRYDPGAEAYVIDVPKDRLKDAPSFDGANPPDFADESWADRVGEYYDSLRAGGGLARGGEDERLRHVIAVDQAGNRE